MAVYEQAGGATGRYEPMLGMQVLRRCEKCHEPHPLARKPPAPDGECPDCGAPSINAGPVIEVPAVITGNAPPIMLARFFLWIGNKLNDLAKGL